MSNLTEHSMRMRTPRTSNGCLRNITNSSSGEEVRTLFVSGLPMDVRLRELYLLFRCYEGYEGSFLKLISSKPGKPPQPIAFVSFDTRKQAEKALEELQGVHFDPASAQTLRLEFARTNSRVSPKQQSYIPQQSPMNVTNSHLPPARNGQYLYYVVSNGSSHLSRGSGTCLPAAAVGAAGQNVLTLADCWAPTRMHNIMPSVSYTNPTAATLSPASSTAHLSVMNVLSDSESSYSLPPPMCVTIPAYPTPVSTPDLDERRSSPEAEERLKEEGAAQLNATLFVANVDKQATEDEISTVFSSCSGFVKLNLVHHDGESSQIAFVEFSDMDCAKAAMEKYKGSSFSWITDGAAICIEFAKQDTQEAHSHSPAMECCSPPSSNGTLSPVVTSPQHQAPPPRAPNPRHPPANNHHHQPPPIVQASPPQAESDDLAVPPRPVHPIVPAQYTPTNPEHFNGGPSFIYPSASMLMNQRMIQPMWH